MHSNCLFCGKFNRINSLNYHNQQYFIKKTVRRVLTSMCIVRIEYCPLSILINSVTKFHREISDTVYKIDKTNVLRNKLQSCKMSIFKHCHQNTLAVILRTFRLFFLFSGIYSGLQFFVFEVCDVALFAGEVYAYHVNIFVV